MGKYYSIEVRVNRNEQEVYKALVFAESEDKAKEDYLEAIAIGVESPIAIQTYNSDVESVVVTEKNQPENGEEVWSR